MQGSRRTVVLRSAAIVIGALAVLPAQAAAAIAPPEPVSPNAEASMVAYIVMGILATLIALGVIVGLLAAARRRGSAELEPERRTRGTGAIQRGVASMLGFVAVIAFIFGVVVTDYASEVQPSTAEGLDPNAIAQVGLELPEGGSEPLVIDATAQQWLWRYEYPGGVFSYHELVVPVHTAVIVELDSTDLIHRWWVPSLAGAFDAIPGNENRTWFRADETGTFEGRSTAFSGPGFNAMRTKVTVLEPVEFEAWLDQQEADIQAAQDAVQQAVEEGTAPGVSIGADEPQELPEDEGTGE